MNSTPIQHIIVACQENRSFDHYFGYYPNAGSFGVPPGFTQPNGQGGTVAPYHLTSQSTKDISHEWPTVHSEWDNGKMDGFYTADGMTAIGYYDASDLAYYYSLAGSFTLCGNYFCSQLGPTYPNRMYLMTGTSGGNTSNNMANGSLNYPTIVDYLDLAGITWKCYNCGVIGSLLSRFNPLLLFSKWYKDPRLFLTEADYKADLRKGTLPQVSFIFPGLGNCEHPPMPIGWGQNEMQEVISALMQSSAWTSSALLLTWDEGGGFFDHVPPPTFDAYGAGFRVPMLVVSPFAMRGYVAPNLYEHSSVLKFIEAIFNLPPLSSINHQFDTQTPGQNNAAANGQPYGPPAPPRDGRSDIGNLTEVFNFNQSPAYHPALAAAPAPAMPLSAR